MARVDDIVKLMQGQFNLVFSSYTQTVSYDASGPGGVVCPNLLLSQSSTETAGQNNAFIQISAKVYSGFPTVSLASNVSGQPDVMQVCLEADATTAARSVLTAIFSAQMMSILASMNVEIWLYLAPNGTVPALAQLTTTNYVGAILADPRHPNVGQ